MSLNMAQTRLGTSEFPESTQNDMEHVSQGPQTPRYLYSSQKRRVLRFWAWEILSVCLAIGLLVAIFSILVHFDGRPVPSLPFSITLNTLIAFLATIMRASILLAVAEILGQAKWLWFSRPTASPMNNLQHFDSASRGLFGSLRLLSVAPNSIFAFVGSIVIAVSLAIGSFTQQAVKTVDCVHYMGQVNASVPVAQYMGYSGGPVDPTYAIGPGDGLTNMQLPVDMKGTMVNGLVNPAGNDSAISATCQTGNCTFQAYSDNITYSSIGFCSACIDTTSFVTNNGPETFDNVTSQLNWTLPNGLNIYLANGYTLLNTSTDGDLSWASQAFTDEFRNVALESIVNFTTLTFTKAPCTNISGSLSCPHNVTGTWSNGEWDYAAASCALYPCLKNYHGSVTRGVLTEDIISSAQAKFNWIQANVSEYTYYNPSQTFMVPGNMTALKDPCVIDGFEYTAASNFSGLPETPGRTFTPINVNGTNYTAPEECLYTLSQSYVNGMLLFFDLTLIKWGSGCIWADDSDIEPDCGVEWWLAPLFNSKMATYTTLSTAMDQFTAAITNKFRTSGSSNYDIHQAQTAMGVVIETTVCIKFDWEWLLFPILLVSAAGVLLLLIILQSYKKPEQPVWKTSLLPLLFYGPKHGLVPPSEPTPVPDLDDLDKRASQIRARWQSGMFAGFVETRPYSKGKNHDIDMDSLLGVEEEADRQAGRGEPSR